MGTVSYDYSGKVVLVTGAGSGIGRALAHAFSACGAALAIADINLDSANATVDSIEKKGGTAKAFQVDVANEAAVAKLVGDVQSAFGKLDVALNNAGIEAPVAPMVEVDGDSFRRVSEVNLSSVFYAMKSQIPAMLANGGGVILNTASISGLMGGYNLATYTATKHGVVGLSKGAAMDYADKGNIRINALCPGLVDTPFIGELPPPVRKRLIDGIPMRRPAAAEEIARAALWLCSDGASYVTGHAMVVDGGASLGGEATRIEFT